MFFVAKLGRQMSCHATTSYYQSLSLHLIYIALSQFSCAVPVTGGWEKACNFVSTSIAFSTGVDLCPLGPVPAVPSFVCDFDTSETPFAHRLSDLNRCVQRWKACWKEVKIVITGA